MENQHIRDKTFEKFTWMIENFSELDLYNSSHSKKFFLGGYSCLIVIAENFRENHLAIYLVAENLGVGHESRSRIANFKLSLVNQVNSEMTITYENEYQYEKILCQTGFEEFIHLDELLDSSSGFILNGTCMIEVEISLRQSGDDEDQVDHAQVCDMPTEYNCPLSEEIFGELVDFRDLGKIEKAFVPLLEEVCICYPSLVECQQKRSPRFREWAFTALGEVLHFLKTKKVKDMNDDACNHLQTLWEELDTFKFDLSWFEHHVQHALDMKSYIKRGEQVKKMKENVADLEMKLVAARRDLARVEDGFEEMHLDAKLGYGGR